LKPLTQLLLVAIFIFLILSSRSQKNTARYTDCDKAIDLYWEKNYDSAFRLFNKYVNNPDDTLKKGVAYSYMGDIQWNIGDLYGAQESLINALHTLDPLNKSHRTELGNVYNLLGNINLDLKLYDEAIKDYDSAITFVKVSDDMFEFMNGKATALQKKGSYDDAISIYDSILNFKITNQRLVARIIDNRARTKWIKGSGKIVLPEFWTALKIRVDSLYNSGLNASYAHLSDYYSKSNADSALWYAQKMYKTAKTNQSPDDVLEAIDKLIRLNSSPVVIKYFYDEFKRVNDSLHFSRDTTRNRFVMIKYDIQKNKADNLALSYAIQKSKADNLTLQQDIIRQKLLMYGLIAVAIIVIAGLSTWYTRHRKRIKQESENEIRNARLKTSQKVHDVVANQLYRIMNELEHGKTIEKEPLLNKIEVLYEKSRDISYEDAPPDSSTDYTKQFHDLLMAFDNEQTKINISGNGQAFWNKVTSFQKNQLQLTFNEIMVNMKKHSQAKNVVIELRQEQSKSFITYKDDGTGFPAGLVFGNGLKNTVSRIQSLNGEINFGQSGKEGALIAISFPVT